MSITESDLAEAMTAVLALLEERGISQERVALGLVGDDDGTGMFYDFYVGATQDRDAALNIDYVITRGIMPKSKEQVTKLLDREAGACPRCGSLRYGIESRADGIRSILWNACMDCKYERKLDK